ncbi:hypothetical protein [Nannocystis radixulma]|uniref:Uncharacterized protein n=1 Tax=Nannocystis radixulma TaxID=2995305 RepID=A0ABT5AWH6_9BACT|nr:hypothetical protein [Nannocystis radixulma]MDC0666184.1 hypothetical protein [Nannocystis radixulma]
MTARCLPSSGHAVVAGPEHILEVVVVSVVPVAGTTITFRCSGCSLRFRVAPTIALVLLGMSVAMLLWLIAIAPEIWPFFAALAVVPALVLIRGLYMRRLHRRAGPETAALLARALGDERIQALLRRASGPDKAVREDR